MDGVCGWQPLLIGSVGFLCAPPPDTGIRSQAKVDPRPAFWISVLDRSKVLLSRDGIARSLKDISAVRVSGSRGILNFDYRASRRCACWWREKWVSLCARKAVSPVKREGGMCKMSTSQTVRGPAKWRHMGIFPSTEDSQSGSVRTFLAVARPLGVAHQVAAPMTVGSRQGKPPRGH